MPIIKKCEGCDLETDLEAAALINGEGPIICQNCGVVLQEDSIQLVPDYQPEEFTRTHYSRSKYTQSNIKTYEKLKWNKLYDDTVKFAKSLNVTGVAEEAFETCRRVAELENIKHMSSLKHYCLACIYLIADKEKKGLKFKDILGLDAILTISKFGSAYRHLKNIYYNRGWDLSHQQSNIIIQQNNIGKKSNIQQQSNIEIQNNIIKQNNIELKDKDKDKIEEENPFMKHFILKLKSAVYDNLDILPIKNMDVDTIDEVEKMSKELVIALEKFLIFVGMDRTHYIAAIVILCLQNRFDVSLLRKEVLIIAKYLNHGITCYKRYKEIKDILIEYSESNLGNIFDKVHFYRIIPLFNFNQLQPKAIQPKSFIKSRTKALKNYQLTKGAMNKIKALNEAIQMETSVKRMLDNNSNSLIERKQDVDKILNVHKKLKQIDQSTKIEKDAIATLIRQKALLYKGTFASLSHLSDEEMIRWIQEKKLEKGEIPKASESRELNDQDISKEELEAYLKL
ncbi:hypothetical protein K502DRAFT_367247 [Neoconidiobolus thromboides FSU 785]|nr:hypothetical protein K502DRAFT_367247 [Neoconidiobolus thromboides FSU 785]